MSNVKLIRAHYDQGLAAYHAGHGIGHLLELTGEIEQQHEKAHFSSTDADGGDLLSPEKREALYDERRNAVPSLIAGFADAVLEDIRLIASQRRGQRA